MSEPTVGFIGGGNMARSLIGGLIADGLAPGNIWVAEPDAGKGAELVSDFGINTSTDNAEVANNCENLILAVKPQIMAKVCEALAPKLTTAPLIISIAAGIRSENIDTWLGGKRAIVRTMPNTPALLGCGATGLYANSQVSEDQKQAAERITRAVGVVEWFPSEDDLDSVTALSGSGPAYFFLLMEAMQQAGEAMGIPADKARLLTLQTALGAAKMAIESDEAPRQLRQRVTSPGGTTERAINAMQSDNFETIVVNALKSAKQRSEELAKQFGESS